HRAASSSYSLSVTLRLALSPPFPYTTLFRSFPPLRLLCLGPRFREQCRAAWCVQDARESCRAPVGDLLRIGHRHALLRGLMRPRSEEHTSELQSRFELVCRLPREKKNVNGPR